LAKLAQRKSGFPSSSGVVPSAGRTSFYQTHCSLCISFAFFKDVRLDDDELDGVLRTMAIPAKKYQLRFDTVQKSLLGRQVVNPIPGVGAFEAAPSSVSRSKL